MMDGSLIRVYHHSMFSETLTRVNLLHTVNCLVVLLKQFVSVSSPELFPRVIPIRVCNDVGTIMVFIFQEVIG